LEPSDTNPVFRISCTTASRRFRHRSSSGPPFPLEDLRTVPLAPVSFLSAYGIAVPFPQAFLMRLSFVPQGSFKKWLPAAILSSTPHLAERNCGILSVCLQGQPVFSVSSSLEVKRISPNLVCLWSCPACLQPLFSPW